jgi:NADPH-dependent ferric siderophore reductase
VSTDSPFVLARAAVASVDRISPTFARITFAGDELADFGRPGATLDQRIKVVLPRPGHPLPAFDGDDWWTAWQRLPEATRGTLRTYSIRDLLVSPAGTRVVIDFVLHLAAGASGPAATWADAARPGDEVLLLGPRRTADEWGGVEYEPGDATTVLLAGDETAAPAIARILEDVGRDIRGVAFIEVPDADDVLAIDAPAGVELRWLPRADGEHGSALIPAVLDHLDATAAVTVQDLDDDEMIWETPTFSGLGETLPTPADADGSGPYVWLAGESGVVTTLRRRLVRELGMPRHRVAFMGYWRRGVAMRG